MQAWSGRSRRKPCVLRRFDHPGGDCVRRYCLAVLCFSRKPLSLGSFVNHEYVAGPQTDGRLGLSLHIEKCRADPHSGAPSRTPTLASVLVRVQQIFFSALWAVGSSSSAASICKICSNVLMSNCGSGDANGSKTASESGPFFQHVLGLEVPSGTASMLISVQQLEVTADHYGGYKPHSIRACRSHISRLRESLVKTG